MDHGVDKMKATILLVEDELEIGNLVELYLKNEGFNVVKCGDGIEAKGLIESQSFDLAILDIMLPNLDGLTILETLRRAGKNTPVLFLTAKDAVEDRVRGLELGADDYLVKPFAFSELLARIRVVLRRVEKTSVKLESTETQLLIADLSLNLLKHEATRAGQKIDLTPKEFVLLQLLMRKSGEVLSRMVLAEQVWGMHFDSGTNVVDVAVRRLRNKIDEGFAQKLIHAKHGVGYILEARSDNV